MIVPLACVLLASTSARNHAAAARQALWEDARTKLRQTSDKLKELGISLEVAKEDLARTTGAFDSVLNVNCVLTSDQTMRVELAARAGGEGDEVQFSGAFEWGEHVDSLSGSGSVSSAGGCLSSAYEYNHDNGESKWSVEGNEGVWDALVQMGDLKAGPVAAGLKLGALKVLIDPYVMAKYVVDHGRELTDEARHRIGGVSTRVDLTDLAYALANAPTPPPHFAESRLVVSLKGLVASGASDLGRLNSVDGLLIDGNQGDALLLGTHDPTLQPIPTSILTTMAHAEFVDEGDPYISIDPNWEDITKPMHARIGGVPTSLVNSDLIARMLHADYEMKGFVMGASHLDGLTSLRDLLTPHPDHLSMMRQRFWIMPQPLTEAGDVRIGTEGSRTLYTFTARPVIRTMSANADAFAGGTPTVPGPAEADIAASDITKAYARIEQDHPESGFGEVRQILQLSTALAIARREALPKSAASVIESLAALPVPTVEIPREFAPMTVFVGNVGSIPYSICGGITSVPSVGRPEQSAALAAVAAGVQMAAGGWQGDAPPVVADTGSLHHLLGRDLGDALIHLADAALRIHDNTHAIELATAACTAAPDYPAAWLEATRANIAGSKYDAAVGAATKGAALDPENPEAHIAKAIALFVRGTVGQAWLPSLRAGRLASEFPPVQTEVDRALELRPNLGEAYWLRASLDALEVEAPGTQGSLTPAIEAATDGLTKAPEFTMTLALRAELYQHAGQSERALADADAYIAVNPGDLAVRELRGDIYLKANRPADALREYQVVASGEPKSAFAHAKAAEAAVASGDDAEALEQASAAINLQPSSSAYLFRAKANERLGIFPSAVYDYRNAASLAPTASLDRSDIQRHIDACLAHMPVSDEWMVGGEASVTEQTPKVKVASEHILLTVHKGFLAGDCTYALVNTGPAVTATLLIPEIRFNILAGAFKVPRQLFPGFSVTVNGKPVATRHERNPVTQDAAEEEELVTVTLPPKGKATVREQYRTDATFADMGDDLSFGEERNVVSRAAVFALNFGSWDRPGTSATVTIQFDADTGYRPADPIVSVPAQTLLDYSALRSAMLNHGVIGYIGPVTPRRNGRSLTFSRADVRASKTGHAGMVVVLFKYRVTKETLPGG